MKYIDYPAGHSMDSKWFAVDKDGNVGFFNTSSAATMPIQFDTQELWTEFLKRYSTKVTEGLHKLILPDQQINEIINQCTEDKVAELIENGLKEKYLFFEGFFQLNDGVSWEDLYFDKALANAEYDFALLLSEDKQIYYISDVYHMFDVFLAALKEAKIKACVEVFMEDSVEDYDSKMGNTILNGYQFEGQDWTESPYRRLTNPAQPLNINQFSPEAKNIIFKFENLSFKDFPYFQPIEFVPCQSYGFYYDNPAETGYARVTLSDNETEAYVAVCLREWVDEIINNCSRCNDYCNRFEKDIYKTHTKSENPKIIILQQYQKIKNNHDSINEIIDLLNIDEKDWYSSNCIKCVKKKVAITDVLLNNRFEKCFRNLEKEVEIIQPLLIITSDNESFLHLSSQFKINQVNTALFDIITINNNAIPILNFVAFKEADSKTWNDLKTKLNKLLNSERVLTERPRIIEIERNI